MKKIILATFLFLGTTCFAQHIDRQALVARNNPHVVTMDSLSSLTVGNGGFAMTVDGTGLQSFPQSYSKGVPLGTMSDWGWHSFANPNHYKPTESWRDYDFGRGRKETYATQIKDDKRKKAAGVRIRLILWRPLVTHRLI